jgi:Glycosyltransferase
VIAVGRLEWQKGFDRLIKIWAIVSKEHPDWCLDIFGEGTLETDLRKAIQDAQLNNISILPFTQKISMEYANSSILVQTSRFEGFSLALLEAVRHGLPCITFDYPYGPRDLIDNGENGYIIEDDNKKPLGGKPCYLMEHHELRKQFCCCRSKKGSIISYRCHYEAMAVII